MNALLASLSEQQNQLIAQILASDAAVPNRGLAAYRANALANAKRALSSTFPVIAQLVGDDNFSFVSRGFLRGFPPQRGDLAQWGEKLGFFLTQIPQLASLPFLADVAHLEWALHTCAGDMDQAQDLGSFAALTEYDPSRLLFRLAPGAGLLASAYPAAAIFLAHHGQLNRVDLDVAFDQYFNTSF